MATTQSVAGYLRVSTDEQARSGLGLSAQRERIEAEADRRGWKVEWFIDDGHSARDLDRPGIKAAMNAVSSGECRAIVVAKLDRLSRSVFDLSGLLRRGEREGWGLVLLDFDLDTTTPTGKLVAHVVSAVAEFERDRVRERTREALAVAKANGQRLGRPPKLPEDVVQRLVAERRAGATLKAIAGGLNDDGVPTAHDGRQWWPSTVKSVLNRAG
jgi:DNA invertase Pin-like site-specific DNA recombinase